jgi:N-acetylgalactosamine kinase
VTAQTLFNILERPSLDFKTRLREIYGSEVNINKRIKNYQRLVSKFAKIFGDQEEVVITRAPGRVNLLGMHIDHRGGAVNPIAVKEILVVAARRQDDIISLFNERSSLFPPRQFKITQELPRRKLLDWETWCQRKNEEMVKEGKIGDWVNYVKAPILFLQNMFRRRSLSGMNVLVGSTLPLNAGLSSSSALGMAIAEAFRFLNALPVDSRELVKACGKAEWYVGTRGGEGDHAAIKFAQPGRVSHIEFQPLRVENVPLAPNYKIILCNTFREAKKTANARDIFNQKIASYEIGFKILKKSFPKLTQNINSLSQISKSFPDETIYLLLKTLPEKATRREVFKLLNSDKEFLEKIFATHREPSQGYALRGVCLFGIAECRRSEIGYQKLKEGKVKEFAHLINTSHQGDRVSVSRGGRRIKFSSRVSTYYLNKLIDALNSSSLRRQQRAALALQPGSYGVSCQEADEIVDIALRTPRVLSARIVGAGLGGCVAVLAETEGVEEFIKKVTKGYYEKHRLSPAIEICQPVGGSGVIIK